MTPTLSGSAEPGSGHGSRLGAAFQAARGSTGLIPYLTAGYPSPDQSLDLLRALEAAGARAVEVGIPFSDPIADGPDLQRASEQALRHGVGAREALELIRRFRASSALPVVVMTYANPIHRIGIARFAGEARAAGVDGVLVSDLPPDESPESWSALDAAGLDTVVLVAPTTDARRLPRLVARSRGFVYCLARTGVTGAGAGESGLLEARIAEVRALTPLPVAVGFGISSPDRARALRGIADAIVVGAAFARVIAEGPPAEATSRVERLARELVRALGENGHGG